MHSKPTKRQLEFQSWEFGVFIHFGVRTFNENSRDWDGSVMSIETFNPTSLNCENWVKTAKEAGAKYMVLTAKHHDGFALWDSKYTGYSVAATPWKDGKGDVIKEYSDACEKYGMKKGIYYSPADAGMKQRSDDEYDEYFIKQISELMTGYGKIDILWFDGNGSGGHKYDWKRILTEIRDLQPEILIFGLGDPDIRWVGNEAGIAPNPNWNLMGSSYLKENAEHLVDITGGGMPETAWLPAECDFMMRESNWFYNPHDEHTVKSLSRLMGIYYYSVGRGANMLINIGPDRRGLLPEKDAERLLEFGAEIKNRFSNPVASISDFKKSGNIYKLDMGGTPQMIDHLILSEDLSNGEHIKRFSISCIPAPYSMIPIKLYDGYNVGHKAICKFPEAFIASLTIEILESSGEYELTGADVFYAQR